MLGLGCYNNVLWVSYTYVADVMCMKLASVTMTHLVPQ